MKSCKLWCLKIIFLIQSCILYNTTYFPGSTTPTIDEDYSTDYPEGPEPTPFGQCILPLQPRKDTSVKPGDGIRFGNTPFSRHEFTKPSSFINSILDESTFALEFKSTLNDGVIFYVSGSNHIDFVGLIMHSGKVWFTCKCLNYVYYCDWKIIVKMWGIH